MAEPNTRLTVEMACELYTLRFGSPVYHWYSNFMGDPTGHVEFLRQLGVHFPRDNIERGAPEMLTLLLDHHSDL